MTMMKKLKRAKMFKFTSKDTKYPVELIQEMIFRLKELGLSPEEIDIYLDLDNNLALFSPMGDPEALEKMQQMGFFANLRPLDDGIDVVGILIEMGFNVYILSACIERNGDEGASVKAEKIEWVKKYMPFFPEENIILCMTGEDKFKYVKGDIRKSILVDDYHVNLISWIEAGGFAIKKTSGGLLNNGKRKERNIPTVKNFYELFYVFYKLEILD